MIPGGTDTSIRELLLDIVERITFSPLAGIEYVQPAPDECPDGLALPVQQGEQGQFLFEQHEVIREHEDLLHHHDAFHHDTAHHHDFMHNDAFHHDMTHHFGGF